MKTTKAHFELFKKECKKWLDILGLKDWQIYYEHQKRSDELAGVTYNTEGRNATISLSQTWLNINKVEDDEVRRSAAHEIFELLVADIVVIGRSRYISRVEMDIAIHVFVRRLENTLFEMEV